MTAWLNTNAPQETGGGAWPGIIADTIATRDLPKTAEFAEFKPVTPSTASDELDYSKSTTFLRRKIAIVGNFACTLAGHSEHISTVLKEARFKIDDGLNGADFASWLCEAVNRFNQSSKLSGRRGVIELCGVVPEPGSFVTTVLTSYPVETTQFGMCHFGGSGAEELKAHVLRLDGKSTFSNKSGYWRTHELGVLLNGQRFFEEIGGGTAPHWGGCFESVCWSGKSKGWEWGPSQLHMSAFAATCGPHAGHVNLTNRGFAYDPQGRFARLLSYHNALPTGSATQWIIHDLLQENLEPDVGIEYWSKWKADVITLTVGTLLPTRKINVSSHYLDWSDVFWEFSGDRFGISPKVSALDRVSKSIMDRYGIQYKGPSTQGFGLRRMEN
ncbi:hypothetical protein [Sphingomonas turrisvirgatae]|uniref:hypothetical protein n=1 Tax=Sphingomonas turrisvirgatae TaxID=1888892 RepID=UPI0010421EC1|nr:hypothetical protein [Sphingomonas turrisvirgatae]